MTTHDDLEVTTRFACSCGSPLIEDADDLTVKPVGGSGAVPFRRKTDYVICTECLRVYPAAAVQAVASLRRGGGPAEAGRADGGDETPLERLERLLAERRGLA